MVEEKTINKEKVALTIRLNKTVHEAMTKYKQMTGLSLNSQVYTALSEWLYKKKLLDYKGELI